MCAASLVLPVRRASRDVIYRFSSWFLSLLRLGRPRGLRGEVQRRLIHAGFSAAAPLAGNMECRWVRSQGSLVVEVREMPGLSEDRMHMEVVAVRPIAADRGSVWEQIWRTPPLLGWVLADPSGRPASVEHYAPREDGLSLALTVQRGEADGVMARIDALGAVVPLLLGSAADLYTQLQVRLWTMEDDGLRTRLARLLLDLLPPGEADACARELARDALPEIRLLAACHLHQDGVPALLALVASEETPTSVAQGALDAFARRGGLEALGPILPRLLTAPPARALALAPQVLGLLRDAGRLDLLVPHLEGVMAETPAANVRLLMPALPLLPPELRARAIGRRISRLESALVPSLIDALAELSVPGVEAVMNFVLHGGDEVCGRAAAGALARIGTPRSLGSLRAMANNNTLGPATRAAAAAAVKGIRGRFPETNPDAPSFHNDEVVLEPEAGTISLHEGSPVQPPRFPRTNPGARAGR